MPPCVLDVIHGANRFNVCPARFQSCFGLVFLGVVPPVWNRDASVTVSWKYVTLNKKAFTEIHSEELMISLRKYARLLKNLETSKTLGTLKVTLNAVFILRGR